MDDEPLEEGRRVIRDVDVEEHVALFERLSEGGPRQWFLVTGNRMVVAFAMLAAVSVTLVALGSVRTLEMRTLLSETTTIQTLFTTLLSGIILLVSIVVSVNSIVLSQELTSIEQQQGRIESSMEFRRSIGEYVSEGVAPTTPPAFLEVLLDAVAERVDELEAACADVSDEALRADVDAFVQKVRTHVDEVESRLEGEASGTADILLAGLSYDYSWQLYAIRQIRAEHEDAFPAAATETVDELLDLLKQFATGRGYFKTLYYEQEFANLSTALLYVSLPAIVFMSYVLLALDAAQIPEVQVLGVDSLLVYVIFAYTVALAPYIVFTSFLIRSTVVARRTLGAGPFVVRHDTVNVRGDTSSVEEEEGANEATAESGALDASE